LSEKTSRNAYKQLHSNGGLKKKTSNVTSRAIRLLAGVIGCLLCCQLVMAKDVLRVLAWPGYADPDVVHDFERAIRSASK
jgi:spermidine/putrescine-binding protein